MQINERLRAGGAEATYPALAGWIFDQTDDDGKPCSVRWQAADCADGREKALHACGNAIHRWFKGPFKRWLREQSARDEEIRFIENIETRLGAAGDDGDQRLLRSVLLDTVSRIRSGETQPEEKAEAFAVLTRAWTRLIATKTAAEKLTFERDKWETLTCEKFLTWSKDERARAIAESTATNAEKIAQLRGIYFSDVDRLEESGEVELPK